MLRERFNTGWYVQEKGSSFALSAGEANGPKAVTLPHDAMLGTERTPDAWGGNKKAYFQNKTWEYTKEFDVPEEYARKKIYLEFEGVFQRAMVYINGDLAGQRPYGYSCFVVDADRFLQYGQMNRVTVVARTADDSRWYTGAGIYRDVNLLVADQTHIKPYGHKISTPEVQHGNAVVLVNTQLQNDGAKAKNTVRVTTELVDSEGTILASDTAPITVFRGETATLRQRLYLSNPTLWDVDSPSLYFCHTKVFGEENTQLDESIEKFGVRNLSLDTENGLSINGRSVKLRGACVHHDNGPIGAVSTYAAEKRRVAKLKAAGFNAIRMSHNPAAPALLRACDELGMLVMDEAFDMWTESKSDFDYAIDFPEWWERDIQAMVDKDYNHPCVVMYSIGNEIQDTGSPNGSAWGRKLADTLKGLDASRYTINGINGMVAVMELLMQMRKDGEAAAKQGQSGTAAPAAVAEKTEINNMMSSMGDMMKGVMVMDAVTQATEESFACVDIAGYNYMDSRYEMDKQLFPNRIICGTETFPMDIDRNWRMVQDNGYIIGDFTWTGWEYLGEAGLGAVSYADAGNVYAAYPALVSMSGDIDILGQRRPVSYYREIVFGLRTQPYIAVHRPEHYHDTPTFTAWSWTDSIESWTWDGFEGKPVRIDVYSASEEVELLLNGKPIARKPTGEANRFKAIFETEYQPGEMVAVAYDGGKETGRFTLATVSGTAQIELATEQATVRHNDELAYIWVKTVNEAGVCMQNHDTEVQLVIDGPCELLGFANAAGGTTESMVDKKHSTFEGKALAVLRPTGKGTMVVTANAPGLAEAKATVEVL